MSELGKQKFNDDLLIEDQDRELAKRGFPRLASILVFPELVTLFEHFDQRANRAKSICHTIGMTAVFLGVLALLGAAAAPLIELLENPWPEAVGVALALLGVLSVCVGAFGVFFAQAKNEWLRARFMTERLRQFHFQALVFRTSSILVAARGSEGLDAYITMRKQWLAKFQLSYENHLEGQLRVTLSDETDEQFKLHSEEEFHNAAEIVPVLEEMFDAYRTLRYEHQIGYASYKLGDENLHQPLRQKAFLTILSWTCIVVVFLTHLLIALSMKPGWLSFLKDSEMHEAAWVHVVVLWAAIIALAARAFEEGLQPAREVARYSSYRAAMVTLERSFNEAEQPAEKLRVMQATERVIYQEMQGFLKTNHEAKFVL